MPHSQETVEVDTTKIPSFVRSYLLDPITDVVSDYMKQPGVKEKYEAWLKKKSSEAGNKEKALRE